MSPPWEVVVEQGLVEPLTQFGVAGLMGALWVWERLSSRRREAQLTEAHERLMGQRMELKVLVRLVRQNTEAIEGFRQAQRQVGQILERMEHDRAERAA